MEEFEFENKIYGSEDLYSKGQKEQKKMRDKRVKNAIELNTPEETKEEKKIREFQKVERLNAFFGNSEKDKKEREKENQAIIDEELGKNNSA